MPVTVDGHRGAELLHLENAIAACAIWRAVVEDWDVDWAALKAAADADAGTEEAARAAVIWEKTDVEESMSQGDDPEAATPRCLIRHMSDGEITRAALDQFDIEGMLVMEFELPIPTEYLTSNKDHLVNFLNIISRLEVELATAVIEQPGSTLDVRKLSIGRMGQVESEEGNGLASRLVEYFVGYGGPLL